MGLSVSKLLVPSGIKRALLVGCAYPNTEAELSGSCNDVVVWKRLLTRHFGFDASNVKVLVDVEASSDRPTRKNIMKELRLIVSASKPGDIIFFQFSGHGFQVPADEGGDYEEDGLDEALCPTDLCLILDDDLRDILSELNDGVKFTMVADCCHSGTMLDHEEIISFDELESKTSQEKKTSNRGIPSEETISESEYLKKAKKKKNRSLDFVTYAKMFYEQNRDDKPEELKSSQSVSLNNHGEDSINEALSVTKRDLERQKSMHVYYSTSAKVTRNELADPNKGILISACQSWEMASEYQGADGTVFGALTYSIMRVLGQHKNKHDNPPITNYDLVMKVRQLLSKSGIVQNPSLECLPADAKQNFILW